MIAALFDLDGTLTDTIPLVVAALNAALAPIWGGPRPEREILSLFGPSEQRLLSREAGPAGAEALERFYAFYRAEHDRYAHLYPGVREMLAGLLALGTRLGMVTNKGRISAEITLAAFGLRGAFAALCSGDDVAQGKPDPAGIAQVLRALGAQPEQAFYVGDSPGDMLAARRAGVAALGAAWSSGEGRLRGEHDVLAARPGDVLRFAADLSRRERPSRLQIRIAKEE